MAGINFSIKVNDSEVLAGLNRVTNAGHSLRPVLVDIGELLIESHEQRFVDQVDPDGQPWEPLSPKYQKRKKRHQDLILVLNEHLGDSFRYQADDMKLLFGTDRVYGATHQFGDPARNIPARPFLGVNEEDGRMIERLIGDFIEDVFRTG